MIMQYKTFDKRVNWGGAHSGSALTSKEINRTEHECMNIHPLPPTNTLALSLVRIKPHVILLHATARRTIPRSAIHCTSASFFLKACKIIIIIAITL